MILRFLKVNSSYLLPLLLLLLLFLLLNSEQGTGNS
jgi:hypothetical protein